MTRSRKVLIGALAFSLLSGPAIAIAASGLRQSAPQEGASPAAVSTSTVAVEVPSRTVAAFDGPAAADILAACGGDGLALVASERAGNLDSVGQAALDALRPICEEEGMPLPGSPASGPPSTIVETVTVSASPAAGVTVGAQAPPSSYEEGDHGYDDDDDHGEDD